MAFTTSQKIEKQLDLSGERGRYCNFRVDSYKNNCICKHSVCFVDSTYTTCGRFLVYWGCGHSYVQINTHLDLIGPKRNQPGNRRNSLLKRQTREQGW